MFVFVFLTLIPSDDSIYSAVMLMNYPRIYIYWSLKHWWHHETRCKTKKEKYSFSAVHWKEPTFIEIRAPLFDQVKSA